MKRMIIATDSCSDLSAQQVESMGLKVIPLSLEMEGKTYFHHPDERELEIKGFYQSLREKKVAVTSLINVGQFLDFFEPILKEGHDILYIGFSSALSGTFQSAQIAARELKDKYPDQKLLTIDSLSASAGQGLLVWKAYEEGKKGRTIEEVAKFVEETKLKICHLFTVAELGTLKRGGRLSSTAAFAGTLLKVKPILHVSDEGKLVPLIKVRGRKSSLAKMVDLVTECIEKPKDQTMIISHGDCLEEAQQVGDMIKEQTNVKEIIYNVIGPIIGAHSGPGTIAVFFEGKKRSIEHQGS
jgi:DegV family protein with EDD domain